MKCALAVLGVSALAISLAGCNGAPPPMPPATDSQARLLGDVKYDDAFATAQGVFGRHFEIASADPQTGTITSEPKMIQPAGVGAIANTPTRLVATMVLRQQRGQVVARVTILQQRQEQAVRQVTAPPGEPYSSVPNETPAADLAATSAEQNSLWRTQRRDRAQESLMLQELFDSMHPADPASAPAKAVGD